MLQLDLLTSKSHIWYVTSLGPTMLHSSCARGLDELTVTLFPPDLDLKGVVAHLISGITWCQSAGTMPPTWMLDTTALLWMGAGFV